MRKEVEKVRSNDGMMEKWRDGIVGPRILG